MSVIPEEPRNRPAVATSVEKPRAVQPLHVGGIQSRPSSPPSQNFVTGCLSNSDQEGNGTFSHGSSGRDSGALKARPPKIIAASKLLIRMKWRGLVCEPA